MAPLRVILLFPFYSLFLLSLILLFQIVSTLPYNIHKLSQHHKNLFLRRSDYTSFSQSALSSDFETYFYNQTLDHFNYAPESYVTFKQRYVINSKYWGGAKSNSPIFAYLGEEESLNYDLEDIGFLNDNAASFKSLSVYIEHRYYGVSQPFGSMEEAMKNNRSRGFLNSAQALADYAEILLHVKKIFSAHLSPVIVIGGSYGGMLASWFRLKYPHIALGALASSAPILYFDNITPQNGYYSIVTKDFKEVSNSCYQTIRNSWSEIHKIASEPHGLSILSGRFNSCSPLSNAGDLTDYLEMMYMTAAQYDAPPINRVSKLCKGIDGVRDKTDILGRIYGGVVSFRGTNECINTSTYPSETDIGWSWQTCSEMAMPFGNGENDTSMMVTASPFNLTQFMSDCKDYYGVSPRPHWITTYYGGHNITLVLKRFGSNIIFSNGLRDPYSSGGVIKNISKSIVAVTSLQGSHCMDIHKADKTDPEWLVMQRNTELKIIKGWLTTYNSDLLAV